MKPKDFAVPEVPAYTNYLQYTGVVDLKDLYEFLASFFSRQKFKFYETYLSKRIDESINMPLYIDDYWEAVRNVEEYYRFVIKVNTRIYHPQDIEVTMKDGSKKIFTKGKLWMQFSGKVEMDYEKKWEENSFYAHLRNFYHKYVVFRKIEAIWWDNLYYNVFLKLQSLVKERLKMESEGFEHRYFHKVR